MKPLFDREKEASLIGCILIDNSVLDSYKIFPDMFTLDHHRKLYSVIIAAHARKITVDRFMIAKVDVPREIIALATWIGSSANAHYYVSELHSMYKRRELRQLGCDCISMTETDEPEKIQAYIEKVITGFITQHDKGYIALKSKIPECMESIQYSIDHRGTLSGVDTGLQKLNEISNGWQPSDYVVIGARPSKGKTALMMNMVRAGAKAGKRIGIMSAEMGDIALMKRMMASGHSIDATRMRTGGLMGSDFQKLEEAYAFINGVEIFINDTPNPDFSYMVSEARRMKRNENIDAFYIDYIGLLQNSRPEIPRHEQIAEISRGIKGLARELNIPIIVLSQLVRDAQGRKPSLKDIRESGSIEQDADIIGFLHCNEDGSEILDNDKDRLKYQLIIAKARNYATGDIDLVFEKRYSRFMEATK